MADPGGRPPGPEPEQLHFLNSLEKREGEVSYFSKAWQSLCRRRFNEIENARLPLTYSPADYYG